MSLKLSRHWRIKTIRSVFIIIMFSSKHFVEYLIDGPKKGLNHFILVINAVYFAQRHPISIYQ